MDHPVVIAERAGVDLHHQAIVDAHTCHLGQHLGAEQLGIGRARRSGHDAPEQRGGIRLVEIGGGGGRMAVIARCRAEPPEVVAPVAERREIAVPGPGILAGERAEHLDIGAEILEFGIDHAVRAEGGDDPAAPAALAHGAMMIERVGGGVGRRQDLDVEPLEQRARPERVLAETIRDHVVQPVGVRRRQAFLDPEQRRERTLEPEPGRGAAEQGPVRGERAPDDATVRLDRSAVPTRHAETLERNALAVEHAEDVMIGHDEEPSGIGEVLVPREP